jgi:hypothetical protein
MNRYRITESVGRRVEHVHSYEDLEIHHPSANARGLRTGRAEDFEPRRAHRRVDGEFEEVRIQPDGRVLVKKDFILSHDGPGPVGVPAPVAGYVHYLNDPNAALRIYDRPFGQPGAKLLAQALHMDPRSFDIREGGYIAFGQRMGTMSDVGTPGSVHAHVEAEPAQFRRYIHDIDRGAITADTFPEQSASAVEVVRPQHVSHDRFEPNSHDARAGESYVRTHQIQSMLRDLGYRAPSGAALAVDGHAGPDTVVALRGFAADIGLDASTRHAAVVQALRDTHRTRDQAHDDSPAVLEAGDRGTAVAQLQRTLNRLGPGAALLSEDGEFGPRTRQAVEAFQRVHGLEIDGRVGPATADALDRAQRALPSHASHPGHARFREALDAVHAMEQHACRSSGAHSERLAAAVALAGLDHGLARIDRVELNDRGTLARGVEVSAVRDEPMLNRLTPPVATADALRVPLSEAGQWLDDTWQSRLPSPESPPRPEPALLEPARPLLR